MVSDREAFARAVSALRMALTNAYPYEVELIRTADATALLGLHLLMLPKSLNAESRALHVADAIAPPRDGFSSLRIGSTTVYRAVQNTPLSSGSQDRT